MTEPSTPEEIAAYKARAMAERRAHQTVPNLVWSLLASLAVVFALVALVARPDQANTPTIDYLAIAAELADDVPSALIAPRLDETWWSNRADLRDDDSGPVWTLGLLNSQGDYVRVSQAFGSLESVSGLLPEGSSTTETIPQSDGGSWSWRVWDRSSLDDPGNTPHILATSVEGSLVIVGGGSFPSALSVAATIVNQYPELQGVAP